MIVWTNSTTIPFQIEISRSSIHIQAIYPMSLKDRVCMNRTRVTVAAPAVTLRALCAVFASACCSCCCCGSLLVDSKNNSNNSTTTAATLKHRQRSYAHFNCTENKILSTCFLPPCAERSVKAAAIQPSSPVFPPPAATSSSLWLCHI